MLDFSKIFKIRDDLAEAIKTNDLKQLNNLLNNENDSEKSYVNLNYVDKEGQTPLHRSCLSGNIEIVKLLVKFGASQSIKNKDGWFPIHLASYYGFIDIVLFLININNFKPESIIDVYDTNERDTVKSNTTYRQIQIETSRSYSDKSSDTYEDSAESGSENEESDDDTEEEDECDETDESDFEINNEPSNSYEDLLDLKENELLLVSMDLKNLDLYDFHNTSDCLNNL